jgi:hypothetical protein
MPNLLTILVTWHIHVQHRKHRTQTLQLGSHGMSLLSKHKLVQQQSAKGLTCQSKTQITTTNTS